MYQPIAAAKKKTIKSLLISSLKETRIKQWTKNLLVFASALFSGALLNPGTLTSAFLAFMSFSFMASTIYVINDLVDIEKDKIHPDKCKRPLASGMLSKTQGIILACITFIITIIIALYINVWVLLCVLVYFAMNLSYSLRLKHVVIVDVMIIAAGFVLRAITGALAVGGILTSWFILCTLSLSLFLALGKRRHELLLFKTNPTDQRKVLNYYSVELLDQLMSIITAVLIMFYSMYAASQGSVMMITIPFVLYGIFRYYYLVHIQHAGGKPEDILLNDKHILLTVILFSLLIIILKKYI